MPLVLTSSVDTATTEAADITNLRRSRQSVSSDQVSGQSGLNLLARDRAVAFYDPGLAKGTGVGGNLKRHRKVSAVGTANTQSFLTFWTSTPVHPPPDLTLSVGTQLFKDYKVTRGESLPIDFLITGKKIEVLSIFLTLTSIPGQLLLEKLELLSPGGVVIDEFFTLEDGRQQAKGTIFILPNQTESLPEEVHYQVGVKNNFTRNIVCECGYLKFNCERG